MMKFGGNRTLRSIRMRVKRNGWRWDQSRYDNGSDYVTFTFQNGADVVWVIYNTFNGKFIARHQRHQLYPDLFDEMHEKLESVSWGVPLLKFVYLPLKKEKKS